MLLAQILVTCFKCRQRGSVLASRRSLGSNYLRLGRYEVYALGATSSVSVLLPDLNAAMRLVTRSLTL